MNIKFALYFNCKLMKGAKEGSKPSFLKDSAAVHYRNGRHENSCMAVEPGEWWCRKRGWLDIRNTTATHRLKIKEMYQGLTCKENLPHKTPLLHRFQVKGNPAGDDRSSRRFMPQSEGRTNSSKSLWLLHFDWPAQNFFLGLQTEMNLGDEPEKFDLESFIQIIIYSLIFFSEAVNRAALLSLCCLVSIPIYVIALSL